MRLQDRIAQLLVDVGCELEDLGGRLVDLGLFFLPDEAPADPHPAFVSNGQLDERAKAAL